MIIERHILEPQKWEREKEFERIDKNGFFPYNNT